MEDTSGINVLYEGLLMAGIVILFVIIIAVVVGNYAHLFKQKKIIKTDVELGPLDELVDIKSSNLTCFGTTDDCGFNSPYRNQSELLTPQKIKYIYLYNFYDNFILYDITVFDDHGKIIKYNCANRKSVSPSGCQYLISLCTDEFVRSISFRSSTTTDIYVQLSNDVETTYKNNLKIHDGWKMNLISIF